MDYKDIIELILSENDYTVGGGCAAAISGAMACGLMGMVANLSKGKDFGQTDAQYDEIVAELNDLKARLLEGSVRDNEAYMMIVNAYKLPKTDETEIAERRAAIRRAGVEAASVPLANAKMNHRVHAIGTALVGRSNPACGTDLQAGIDLARVGLNSAKANVDVNLPLIKDEAEIARFRQELSLLEQQ